LSGEESKEAGEPQSPMLVAARVIGVGSLHPQTITLTGVEFSQVQVDVSLFTSSLVK